MVLWNETDFRKSLKALKGGVYVFIGEEDYLKNYCLKAAREAIVPDEALAAFNDIEVGFDDFNADSVRGAWMAPPMMSDRKLVVLRSFDTREMKPTETEELCALVEEASGSIGDDMLIVSFVPEGIDEGYLPNRPSAILGRLSKVATIVRFVGSTPQKLAAWALRHFSEQGIGIDDETNRFFIEYCGRSMFDLSKEIEKLCLFVSEKGRKTVTKEDILFVSIPAEECDAFALSNAALAGNSREALEALSVLKNRQVKPEYVFAEMVSVYVGIMNVKLLMEEHRTQADIAGILKMHEYKAGLYMRAAEKVSRERLSSILDLLAETDLAMKSYGKRGYDRIERLICLL